jgi:WhiB family redox-sensing transcriptional regulator
MTAVTLADLANDAVRWDGAKCIGHDSELWFHDAETNRDAKKWTAKAKHICGGCDLLELCRDWAIEQRIPHGVYGGMSAKERERRRRQIREQQNRSRG